MKDSSISQPLQGQTIEFISFLTQTLSCEYLFFLFAPAWSEEDNEFLTQMTYPLS